jgi:magnesium-transporting ATPase (P-type)
MSVIVRDIKDELAGSACDNMYHVFVKGSPEALKRISNPQTSELILSIDLIHSTC